ncbi:MAG: extracellular solute-binding protein [Halodesulfurarchaeum sp.]
MTRPFTRRDLLRATGTAGTLGLAGCIASGNTPTVSVLAAGSLAVLFEDRVGPAFEAETSMSYRGEFHGSKALIQLVKSGRRNPDVMVSADASLLRRALSERVPWDVVFASNAVGITYNRKTEMGRRLASRTPWYRAILESDGKIARTDPDLDPLGYRTVQLFKLAERYYGIDGLARSLLEKSVIDPSEVHLLASVETGVRPAAVAYRNMAVDRNLPFETLPDRLSFAEPSLAEYYATATYTTANGTTIEGSPVKYNATIPTVADDPSAGRRFVSFLLEHPGLLEAGGLIVPGSFPRPHGPVPEEVMP